MTPNEIIKLAETLRPIVIGEAMDVHRELGPGLLESIYERCLIHGLRLQGLKVEQQKSVQITYKGFTFEEELRCDLLIERSLLVELKAVDAIAPIHKAQVISYIKLLRLPFGLIFNFHSLMLKDGLVRVENRQFPLSPVSI